MAGKKSAKHGERDAPRKATPYYEQVANVLRTQITSVETDQPFRLPSERELCDIHHVSRITISRALDVLQQEGLVQPTHGLGTRTVPEAIRQWKRLRQSRVIQVVVQFSGVVDAPNSYYGQIYQGILRRCEQSGYRLAIQGFGQRVSVAPNLLLPDSNTTLGVICVGLMNEPSIQVYTQAGYQVVCIDYWTTNPDADAIVVDCYGEGQDAANFLLRHGHRSLFYLGNALASGVTIQRESDAELLLAGMQRTLALAGQEAIPPERVRFCNFKSGESVQPEVLQAVEWYLSLRPRPTAGVVFNSGTCGQFVSSLRERGVRCPEDLSVIAKTSDPRTELTCLRADPQALGELAVDALLDRATGRRGRPLRMVLPSVLERGRTVRQIAMDRP